MDLALSPSPATAPAGVVSHRRTKPYPFYVGVAVIMTAMVVAGFWPTYYGPLVRGDAVRPWIFHVHGAVFMGWMLLLVAQVALVAAGHTRIHRKLGTFGIWYGVLVLGVGLVMTFYAPLMHLRSGAWDMNAAASFLALPLADMVLFAGFFGAAVTYRRTPDVHKRLMLLATVALLFAAIARRISFETPVTFLLIWLSPLMAAMAYDWWMRRRVHAVYLTGVVILLAAFTRVYWRESEEWLGIGRVLIAAVQ